MTHRNAADRNGRSDGAAVSQAARTVSLAEAGIRSDAALEMWSTTYGSDQTESIQAILDRALDGEPLRVVWDVRVSVTGLRIPHGVVIAPLPGCGAILRPGSNRPLLADHQSYLRPLAIRNRVVPAEEYEGAVPPGVTADGMSEIHVLPGGIWNCNGWSLDIAEAMYPQDSAPENTLGVVWEGANQKHRTEEEGWAHGVRLMGTRGSFAGTILNSRCFGLYVADYEDLTIERLFIVQQRGQRPEIKGNTDGLHIGRGRRLRVRDYRCSWSGDDFFAIVNVYGMDQLFPQDEPWAYEGFPFTGAGDVSEIYGDVIVGENCLLGLRILSGQSGPLSGGPRVSGVRLRGIRASMVDGGKWLSFQQYTGVGVDPSLQPIVGPGSVGDVVFEDVSITGGGAGELGQSVDYFRIHNMTWASDAPLLTSEFESDGMIAGTIDLSSIRAERAVDDGRGLIHHANATIARIRLSEVDAVGIGNLVVTAGSAQLERLLVSSVVQVGEGTTMLRHDSTAPIARVIETGCEHAVAVAGTGTVIRHDGGQPAAR